MANTTNFGWETPDDTDLVKDGALAMRTLGNAIDTSLVDLKGGTTGQVLSKNTNTDMDFVWTTPNVGDITEVQAGTGISVASGTGPIPVVTNTVATTFDAKGDLVAGTGADTFAKLTVGANNTVLTADSSTSTGLKWAAPSGASFVGAQATANGTSFSYTQNTDVLLTFATENFDTDGFHSTTTNTGRLTIPTGKGGKYLFQGTGIFIGTVPSYAWITLWKNGSKIADATAYGARIGAIVGNSNAPVHGAIIADAAAGDYFELYIGSDQSTGTKTLYGSFSCTYLGA